MSHLSHKDITDYWTKYQQEKLAHINKQKRTLNQIELLFFLGALGFLFGSIKAEKPNHRLAFLVSSITSGTSLTCISNKKQTKIKKELSQLALERKNFFNQFRIKSIPKI